MNVITAISPSKFILFGEHAVVYGEPAIAVAIDVPLRIRATGSKVFMVNNEPLHPHYHSYLKMAIDRLWEGDPIALEVESRIPRASGLGSSAAVTVATVGCLMGLEGTDLEEERVAKASFEVEFEVQGGASPTDTSTCTHGNAVMLTREPRQKLLWEIEKGEKRWFIHHLDLPPDIGFVIGNTGFRGKTPALVAKVRRYYEKSGYARDTIEEIGEITLEGARALQKGDLEDLGNLMDLNHKRLVSLGVGHPVLDRLVEAVSSCSFGAKMTGAGGGGSIVALTDRPDETAKAISKAGGNPIIITPSRSGLRLEREDRG